MPPFRFLFSAMKQLILDIGDSVLMGFPVQALVLYLWLSLVVGFFASLVDLSGVSGAGQYLPR